MALHKTSAIVLLTLGFLAGLSLCGGNLIHANTITVTTTADEFNATSACSLREAIRAANTDSSISGCPAGNGADTINIPIGTFTTTIVGNNENADLTGDLDITQSVTLNGNSTSSTVIDGGGAVMNDRVFDIIGNVNVTIRNLTIKNGFTDYGPGGGINNGSNTGTLNLDNVLVTNNVSKVNGGGIYSGSSGSTSLIVTNSSITNNQASTNGGGAGVYVYTGFAVFSNTIISGNTASSFGGGGIQILNGTITITNSTIINNTVAESDGGGIYNDSGSITITNTTISQNKTTTTTASNRDGGGIYNLTGGTITLTNSLLANNTAAGYGGGINSFGTVTINSSTMSSNKSNNSGGGMRTLSTAITNVNNATIYKNTTDDDNNGTGDGGGVDVQGTMNIQNSIIASNLDKGGQVMDCNGAINSQGYNLIQLTTGCTISGSTTGNITGQNPQLDVLANNGGLTLTHATLRTSPAIRAGNNATCVGTDQRGVGRPQEEICTIGAFEFQTPLRDGGVWNSAFGETGDKFYVGDFNGDGKGDMMIATTRENNDTIVGNNDLAWYFMRGTGTSFVDGGRWNASFGIDSDKYYVADFNGDGKDDIVLSTTRIDGNGVSGDNDLAWYFMRSNGSTFLDGGQLNNSFGVDSDKYYVADFNGDNKRDIAISTTRIDGNAIPADNDLAWYLMRSNGSTFLDGGQINNSFGVDGDKYYVADFNGDHKSDIILSTTRIDGDGVVGNNDLAWYFMRSNGATFLDGGQINNSLGIDGDTYMIGDFTHDGKDDLLIATTRINGDNSYTWYVASSNSTTLVDQGVWKYKYGTTGDLFFVKNFSGDSAADVAITRFVGSAYTWWIMYTVF